jgi:hypothetical protein
MTTRHAIDELEYGAYERTLDLAPTVAEKATEAAVWVTRDHNRRRMRIALASLVALAATIAIVTIVRRRRASTTPDRLADEHDTPLAPVGERGEDAA